MVTTGVVVTTTTGVAVGSDAVVRDGPDDCIIGDDVGGLIDCVGVEVATTTAVDVFTLEPVDPPALE